MIEPAPPPAEPPLTTRAVESEPWWKWRNRPWQFAGAGVIAVVLLALWLIWALPLGRALEPLQSPTLVLVSSDGKAFARRGAYKEAPVDVAQLPKYVPGAFIAIEDRRFYHHFGIDPRGMARALVVNVKGGGVSEGGSTITQQLAKNAFLSNRRTLRRKAQEAVIALYLESRLSKDEILSRYLSSVYFGEGVFGLRAAARQYFNKTPDQLSIGEAAMLAGMVKAPSKLNPIDDYRASLARQRVVLKAMVDTHVITKRQARQARRVRVNIGRPSLPVGSYFADWVSPQAKNAFERAYGEVVVKTTLDSRLQTRAEQIVQQYLNGPGRSLHASQGALIAMRPDGSVVALVGGKDYRQSQFNRAVDAQRQPGSSFKLFVYLTALRDGMTPDSLVMDAPVRLGNWTPQNHEGEYLNRPIPLRTAFARSSNVAAVRVLQKVGVRDVIQTARDLGITSALPRDATIALGSGPVSLMELTSAYAAIDAGQAPVRAHGLADFMPTGDVQRLPARDQQGMMDMMRAVVTSGTGRAASLSVPVFGKTGTTQDYHDALFIGFVGDLVVGVWVGNDDNAPMRRVAGGSLPAQIWHDFASYALSIGQVHGIQNVPVQEPAPTDNEIAPEDIAPNPNGLEGQLALPPNVTIDQSTQPPPDQQQQDQGDDQTVDEPTQPPMPPRRQQPGPPRPVAVSPRPIAVPPPQPDQGDEDQGDGGPG